MAPLALPTSLQIWKPTAALQQRICWTRYAAAEPCFRAAMSGRFDDPLGIFETFYCAPTFETCYAETLLRDRYNPYTGRYEVPQDEHDQRSLSLLLVDFAKLKIVDLYGAGLQAMGLDNKVTMGDYPQTQHLSRAIHDHPDAPDGMVYMSRLAVCHQPALVLFERARPHVRLLPGSNPLPLLKVPEAFAALTQSQSIVLM